VGARFSVAKAGFSALVVGLGLLAVACGSAPEEGATGQASSDLYVILPPFNGCKGLKPLPTTPMNGGAPSCPAYPPSSNANCYASSIAGYAAHFPITSLPWTCPPVRLQSGALWQGMPAQTQYCEYPPESDPVYDTLCVPHQSDFDCEYLFEDLPGQAQVSAEPFCTTNATEIGYVVGYPAATYTGGDKIGGHTSCDVCSTL
jgi:hypothetical protein